jgi:hypothetical protein
VKLKIDSDLELRDLAKAAVYSEMLQWSNVAMRRMSRPTALTMR